MPVHRLLQSRIASANALRIGFDGRALASPAGGVRRYAFELFAAMSQVAPEIEIVALGTPAHVEVPPRVQTRSAGVSLPTNLGWNVSSLPLAARRARLDVFHAPAYTAPLWDAHPLVLTIHDVSYARHPEWYPYKRDPVRRWFYQRSARAADRLITVSAFSRDEIVAAYGIDEKRIHVIPLGVGAPFTNPLPRPVRVAGEYVLHVGDLHSRRDLGVALNAVLDIRRRLPAFRDLQLVLAGTDRGSGPQLRAQASAAGAERAVDFVAVVDDDGLAALYQGARALVYPSRYEGFGLPIVEAMACGTPVIAARAGSIPEVAGDAAILVEPGDVAGFAVALEHVLSETATAAGLASRGRARAAQFTWSRTAQMTLDVYRGTSAGA
jgi:glycosyltransferase involved in cell wall biosynthesis